MSYQSSNLIYKGRSLLEIGESETESPITDIIEINDPSNLVVDIITTAVGFTTGITFKLQTKANEGPWVDCKSATYTTPTGRVGRVNFKAKADMTAGDFFYFPDVDGNLWAASADVTGADPEPTSTVWTGIAAGRKIHVDLSGATTQEEVRDAYETALTALSGFTSTFFFSLNGIVGLFIAQAPSPGITLAITPLNADGSGAGSSYTISITAQGSFEDLTTITITQVGDEDEARTPMRPKARVVITTGADDFMDISAVYVSRKLSV